MYREPAKNSRKYDRPKAQKLQIIFINETPAEHRVIFRLQNFVLPIAILPTIYFSDSNVANELRKKIYSKTTTVFKKNKIRI